MPRIQNENAPPDHDRDRVLRSKSAQPSQPSKSTKPTKLSASASTARRRPLGESSQAPQSQSLPPSGSTKPKPTRTRSALAPLDSAQPQPQAEGRVNVARLPRLKSSTGVSSSTRPPDRVTRERERERIARRPPASPRTPPRQLAPKTPAEQIGRAGAVRAALLNKRRPIVVHDPPPRPRVQRSISVRADEVTANRGAVDRPYAPSPKRSAKADAMMRNMFGGAGGLAPLDEPPSPPCAFGGDDFKFDLV